MTPTTTVPELPADAVLIDVREPDEWAAGHAPGATHIPMGEVVARIAELPAGQLHVICRVGGRSGRVVDYLVANGYDAVNVDGGMQAWAAAGRPMRSTTGADPQVI